MNTRHTATTAQLRRLSLIAITGLALSFAAPQSAHAQSEPANIPNIEDLTEAQQEALVQQLDRGRILYEEKLFDRALKAFEEAYEVYPHPDVLYRIAECQLKLNRDADALKNYREVLRLSPNDPDRDKIEATIKELESRLKTALTVTSNPAGAAVLIDGKAQGTTPTTLKLEPGTYKITIELEGHQARELEAKLIAGQETPVNAQLVAIKVQPDKPLATAKPSSSKTSPWVWTFGGLTAASAVGSVVMWTFYSNASTDVANIDIQKSDIPRPANYNALVDDRNTYGTTAIAFTGLTLALGATTAIIWSMTRQSEGAPSEHVVVAPWVGPHGGGASVGLSF